MFACCPCLREEQLRIGGRRRRGGAKAARSLYLCLPFVSRGDIEAQRSQFACLFFCRWGEVLDFPLSLSLLLLSSPIGRKGKDLHFLQESESGSELRHQLLSPNTGKGLASLSLSRCSFSANRPERKRLALWPKRKRLALHFGRKGKDLTFTLAERKGKRLDLHFGRKGKDLPCTLAERKREKTFTLAGRDKT